MAYYNFSNPEDYKYINLIFEENRFYPVTKPYGGNEKWKKQYIFINGKE